MAIPYPLNKNSINFIFQTKIIDRVAYHYFIYQQTGRTSLLIGTGHPALAVKRGAPQDAVAGVGRDHMLAALVAAESRGEVEDPVQVLRPSS